MPTRQSGTGLEPNNWVGGLVGYELPPVWHCYWRNSLFLRPNT